MKIALLLAALLAAGTFSFLEWRRANRRHLAARLGATLLAVGALALWGWHPMWRRSAPANRENAAALWTAGADPGAGGHRYQFALPDAANAPPGALVLPDVPTLRRRFPAVGTLHVYGDGLEAFEVEALRGSNVVFHPPARETAAGFSFVRCPRVLTLGETLTIQGRVNGTSAPVTLEAPDGTTTEAAAAPGFSVNGSSPPAMGRFVWRLRVGKEEETLGVAVVPPMLPRVLALAGAPRFDTAALRRWFEAAGGTFTARTTVGQGRYRFESSHDAPTPFAAIDAALLAGVDLVLADGRALATLAPVERDTLSRAIADTGLGLLTLADDADPAGIVPALFPWKFSAPANAASDAENNERLARVQWPGQTASSEIALPLAPLDLAPLGNGQGVVLMRDGQGRTLAASMARGRGLVALTLVRETDRWTRGNDPRMFAAYWSELFSTLARRTGAGRWTLAGGDAGPVFVDQPLNLIWTGQTPPAAVTVMADADARPVTLTLASDGEHWRGTFWPRAAGWHRVAAGEKEAALDFYVHPAGTWPALASARRRAATARFAVDSAAASSTGHADEEENVPIPAGVWFALFLLGAGYLWIERRLAGP